MRRVRRGPGSPASDEFFRNSRKVRSPSFAMPALIKGVGTGLCDVIRIASHGLVGEKSGAAVACTVEASFSMHMGRVARAATRIAGEYSNVFAANRGRWFDASHAKDVVATVGACLAHIVPGGEGELGDVLYRPSGEAY